MPDGNTLSLTDALSRYLATVASGERAAAQAELQRFASWAGPDRPVDQLRGHEIASYAERLAGSLADAPQRADSLRAFFAYAKKAGLTDSNLGVHLRFRKGAPASASPFAPAPRSVTLSAEGKAALEAEIASLKAQRPQILSDIQRAMADKDFRENSPLDAARERQGYVEGRIRELEATLQHATVEAAARPASNHAVGIGSTVVLRNLKTGAETRYTLVSPGEVSPKEGRISSESPVGKALLQRQTGEEVEVAAPSALPHRAHRRLKAAPSFRASGIRVSPSRFRCLDRKTVRIWVCYVRGATGASSQGGADATGRRGREVLLLRARERAGGGLPDRAPGAARLQAAPRLPGRAAAAGRADPLRTLRRPRLPRRPATAGGGNASAGRAAGPASAAPD